MRDARLKYAGIQGRGRWGRVRGIAPAGSIDGLALATACRKVGPLRGAIFFRNNEYKGAVDGR